MSLPALDLLNNGCQGTRFNTIMQLPLSDALLLHKQVIIETIIDQLRNISQIEHSRHRSVIDFIVNVLSGFIAY